MGKSQMEISSFRFERIYTRKEAEKKAAALISVTTLDDRRMQMPSAIQSGGTS